MERDSTMTQLPHQASQTSERAQTHRKRRLGKKRFDPIRPSLLIANEGGFQVVEHLNRNADPRQPNVHELPEKNALLHRKRLEHCAPILNHLRIRDAPQELRK